MRSAILAKATPFEETLHRELRDPEFAAAYLGDALEESSEEFLIALRRYVQVDDGMGRMAKSVDVAREALYRMLSENGNPAFRSVESILRASGLRIKFSVQESRLDYMTAEPENLDTPASEAAESR